VLTKAGEELERKKIKDLKNFKENDPEKYSNWKKEFKHDASKFEGTLRDELEKEQATASRRQDRASSHSKAKEAHSDAKKHRENSLFGSVMNVIAPLKTPKTPMDTPQTRRGKKGGRRKRTLKKNR
jgi:LPS O-antigen subunit length determinant protein (WzzB/FepE family)